MKTIQFCLFIVVALLVKPTLAQSEDELTPIYLQTIDEQQYTVVEMDRISGEQSEIFTINTTTSQQVAQILPEDEGRLLLAYLVEIGRTASLEAVSLDVAIQEMIVSPRGDQLLLRISYSACFPLYGFICYGTTQLVVIDLTTRQSTVVFNLGYHDTQYKFPSAWFDYTHPETGIVNLSWLPDQKGIVAGVTYDVFRIAWYSIVVIPLTNFSPFLIGHGVEWTISPKSDQLAIITLPDDAQAYVINTLKLIDFDLATQTMTTQTYLIENRFLSTDQNLAYTETGVLFQIAFEMGGQAGHNGGLSHFDLTSQTWTMIAPDQWFSNFQSYGEQVIMQGIDDRLYRTTFIGNTLTITPITSRPVEDYALSHTGKILVHYADTGVYEILDLAGNTLQAVRLESTHTSGSSERSILQVDF
jgi:hypothetical protein